MSYQAAYSDHNLIRNRNLSVNWDDVLLQLCSLHPDSAQHIPVLHRNMLLHVNFSSSFIQEKTWKRLAQWLFNVNFLLNRFWSTCHRPCPKRVNSPTTCLIGYGQWREGGGAGCLQGRLLLTLLFSRIQEVIKGQRSVCSYEAYYLNFYLQWK